MTPEHIQEKLKRYHIKPAHILGQNFLLDELIIEDTVNAALVSSADTVVEIGPGIGTLTEALLKRGARVIAIEKDERFVPALKALKKEYGTLEWHLGDALKFNFAMLPAEYKVVANIPYYITGKLIQVLLGVQPKPQSITLLVQKEVAENITAKPGALNLLGISVQLVAHPKIVLPVPAEKFYPAPKVDSAVVHIQIPKTPPYRVDDEKHFFRVLRACFAGKRKQIHNTLKNNLGLAEGVVLQALESSGVKPEDRPQHLSIEQWIRLVNAV